MAESYLAQFAARLERECPAPKDHQDDHRTMMLRDALRILYQLGSTFARHWEPQDRAYIEAALATRESFALSGYSVQRVIAFELTAVGKSAEGEILLEVGLAP